MNLQEKIAHLRKTAGLSQEALADQIGVSRQAVSKWETGDATPEIGKLLILARRFDVSTDWLLSEEGPVKEDPSVLNKDSAIPGSAVDWVDSLPGLFGRLISQYGWLSGVYIAKSGAVLAGMGALWRFIVGRMLKSMAPPSDDMFPWAPDPYMNDFAVNNPVLILATAMLAVGLVLLAGGTLLALVLKRRGREEKSFGRTK